MQNHQHEIMTSCRSWTHSGSKASKRRSNKAPSFLHSVADSYLSRNRSHITIQINQVASTWSKTNCPFRNCRSISMRESTRFQERRGEKQRKLRRKESVMKRSKSFLLYQLKTKPQVRQVKSSSMEYRSITQTTWWRCQKTTSKSLILATQRL